MPKPQKLTLTSTGDSLQSLPIDDSAKLTFKEKSMVDLLYPREDFEDLEKNVQQPQNIQQPQQNIQQPQQIQNTQNVQQPQQNIQQPQHSQHSQPQNSPLKTVISSTILFILLNTQPVDQFINRLSKNENPSYRLIMKTIIFAVAMFVISNISFSRFPLFSSPSPSSISPSLQPATLAPQQSKN